MARGVLHKHCIKDEKKMLGICLTMKASGLYESRQIADIIGIRPNEFRKVYVNYINDVKKWENTPMNGYS